MTHDPLCVKLYKQVIPIPAERCVACSVIIKVREDERDNCWAAVAEMEPRDFGELGDLKSWISKPDALAAIETPKGQL